MPAIPMTRFDSTSDHRRLEPMTSTKPKPKPEIDEHDLLPPDEAKRRADEVLRRMLNTPPDPYTPKAKKKRAKRAK